MQNIDKPYKPNHSILSLKVHSYNKKYKLGCAGGVIDNDSRLLTGEPSSNSGMVRHIHLRANTLGKL